MKKKMKATNRIAPVNRSRWPKEWGVVPGKGGKTLNSSIERRDKNAK